MIAAPDVRSKASRWLPVVAAVATPWAVAAALVPFRAHVDNATIALALAVVVVAVTVLTRRRIAGLLSAVSAAAVFDLLFTVPYGSFRINSTRDVQTDVALLVLGVLAGEVAHAIQGRIEELRTSRHRFSFITSLSNLAADGEPVDFLAMSTAAELTTLLELRDCSFTTDAAVAAPLASLDSQGTVRWGPLIWGTECWGLPVKGVTIPVRHRGECLGYLVMHPTPGVSVSREALEVAAAYAAQLGAAVPGRQAA